LKYNNFHLVHPQHQQPVYFIAGEGKEVLGTYTRETGFNATEGKFMGYMAKWWRELTEAELTAFSLSTVVPKSKRKVNSTKMFGDI
jgi:hypothetical protein